MASCSSLFSSRADAQKKYSLFINLIQQDSILPLNDASLKIALPFVQTSFSDLSACSQYIDQLPKMLASKGYPAASIDSLYFDAVAAHINLFLGFQNNFIEINVDSVDKKMLLDSGWPDDKKGKIKIDYKDLQARQEAIIHYYANTGYPFADVKLDSVEAGKSLTKATLKVNKGVLYHIDSIRVYGKTKIARSFLQHHLGISNGSFYNEVKLQNVSRQLMELPYLKESQPFDITMLGTGATLNLYLENKRSSQINFLVGFLPADNITGKSQLTGDINLDLKNALGSGESILLNWQQLQRKSPRLNVGYQHPYIFNSSFGIDFNFNLLKKDSSYLLLNSQLGIQYILSSNQSAKIFIQNQRSYLLQGGYDTNIIKSTKLLPSNIDVNANSIGLDYEWSNTNYKYNPRKGNELRLISSVGIKKISKNNDIINLKDTDSPAFNFNSLYDSLHLKTYQLRFIIKAAHYFLMAKRSALKTAVQVGILHSQDIFKNELFQIGGYKLLRGFSEESIYANQYAVLTAEYRYLVGLNSFLFGFSDVGLTTTQFQATTFRNTFVGVGLGLAFETKTGLLNLSYAVGKRNDVKFDIRNSSKIHFGYINYF